MGWFDGFPFKSREQMDKEEKDYAKRVLPFGEEQKQAAIEVLRQLKNPKTKEMELLFAFINAKDAYLTWDKGEEGEQRARASMHKLARLKAGDEDAVMALVRLDAEVQDMAAYPTAAQVKSAMQEQL